MTLPALIPQPQRSSPLAGDPFVLDAATVIVTPPEFAVTARQLAARIKQATHWTVPAAATAAAGAKAVIEFRLAQPPLANPEAYTLRVTAGRVTITASGAAGAFYAVQTFFQLLPPAIYGVSPQPELKWTAPAVEIEDAPRFRWRGLMIDSARYYQPVDCLKRFLDLMAQHKLNVFHWHLVDDQGWRVEIKKYPKLTEVGAWREATLRQLYEEGGDGVPHGGFYTQEELREVVAYAAARAITVVPEIELPGHSSAALAAYPELGCTDAPGYNPQVQTRWGIFPETYAPKPATLQFLDDVLGEVLDIFPSKFIHIGGDEALKTQWEASPSTRAFMAANGLKDGHELQSWFVRRTEKFLAARGRRLVGWDEIQEGGLAPGATMMAWRDVKWAVEAARHGHDVVIAPTSHTYFDYTEGSGEEEGLPIGAQNTVAKVYGFEPIPADLEPEHHHRVLGAQGQLWRERIYSLPVIERRGFPRLTALSEVVWSPREKRDYADFQRRLPWLLARFDRLGVNYRRPRPGE